MNNPKTNGIQDGVLKEGMTEPLLVTPSTNEENRFTSDMSVITQNQNPSFQPTQNSVDVPEKLQNSRLMIAFAAKLRKLGLVSPRKIRLPNGEGGWVIFMPESLWEIDAETRELKPR